MREVLELGLILNELDLWHYMTAAAAATVRMVSLYAR